MQRDTHRGAGRNLQRYSATLTAMWLSSFSGLIFCDNFFILFLTNIPDWANDKKETASDDDFIPDETRADGLERRRKSTGLE